MVMETVLTEVKTAIGSSQHGHTSTCSLFAWAEIWLIWLIFFREKHC
jgi:hypothetical protein